MRGPVKAGYEGSYEEASCSSPAVIHPTRQCPVPCLPNKDPSYNQADVCICLRMKYMEDGFPLHPPVMSFGSSHNDSLPRWLTPH